MLDSGTVLYDVQWDTVICWTVGLCYMMYSGTCYMMESGTLLYVGQWNTVI